jgi:hypothetical protein
MSNKILTGARAKLIINGQPTGLFSDCSWSIRQTKEPQFILGRYNPAEITQTSQDAVSVSLSGFRFLDKDANGLKSGSPYKVAGATPLKNLLTEGDFSIQIVDRKTGEAIFTVQGCKVTSWSSGVAARGVSTIRVELIGIKAEDEFNKNDEDSGAPNIEDGT